jgi:WD40 repeat protein
MEEHPLLIYQTALPFTPVDSILYKTFHDKQLFPWIAGGFQKGWSSLQMQLCGHSEGVLSVAFSPDGTRIVSGSSDCSIRIWDFAFGGEVCPPLMGHTLSVTSVAYSPDGKQIVSSAFDGTVGLWDARTGAVLHMRPVEASWVNAVCFSPDGKRIISGSERPIEVALGPDFIEPLRGRGGSNLVAFDSNDYTSLGDDLAGLKDLAASMSHSNVCIWDAASSRNIVPPLCGHEGPIYSIAVSPDGKHIVSGSKDRTLRLWDANSGKGVLTPFMGHEGAVYSVAFSSDGTLIASGSSDTTVRVWDTQTSQEVRQPLYGHKGSVKSVCFSPDGTLIVSGSDDKTIRIWDARSGITDNIFMPLCGHEGHISSVAFSPDGKYIVSGSNDTTIRIWNAQSLKKNISTLAPIQGPHVRALAFSLDNTRVASCAGCTTAVWDTASGAKILQLQGHQGSVSSVVFSPDGQYIASGSEDKTVRVWNARTGFVVQGPLQGHQHPITSMAYSPDGFHIVSASDGHDIRVWNASSGLMVFPAIRCHPKWVPSVALHLNPVRIAAAQKGDILCPSELATTHSLGSVVNHAAMQLDIFVPRHVGSGWIVDLIAHEKKLSKLPPSMSVNTVTKSAASQKSVAIGLQNGQVVIMHFPPVMSNLGF